MVLSDDYYKNNGAMHTSGLYQDYKIMREHVSLITFESAGVYAYLATIITVAIYAATLTMNVDIKTNQCV